LKKIHANFNEIYHNIDDVYVANASNEKITGGIIGIYTKMCADSILRDKLFQKGILHIDNLSQMDFPDVLQVLCQRSFL